MSIRGIMRQNWKDQKNTWKMIYLKPRNQCTISELEQKIEIIRAYVYMFTITTVCFFAWVLYLALVQEVSISFFNVMLFMNMVALFDMQRSYNEYQMFIYMKTMAEDIRRKEVVSV